MISPRIFGCGGEARSCDHGSSCRKRITHNSGKMALADMKYVKTVITL